MPRKQVKKPIRTVPMINIGSKFDSPNAKQLIESLTSSLDQAIVLGRTEIGVALAERLGKMGEVQNVAITSSTFQG